MSTPMLYNIIVRSPTVFSRKRFYRIFFFTLATVLTVLVLIKFSTIFIDQTFIRKNSDNLKMSKEIAEKCIKVPDWMECYGKEFADIVKTQDVTAAQNLFPQLQELDSKTRDCHIIAHRMMDAAVEKSKGNWRQYIKLISPSQCNYGFVHGLLEGASEFDPKFKLDTPTISEICTLMMNSSGASGTDQGCAHAVGHLLLAEACGDVASAVSICESLDKNLRFQCFAGTFMENFTQDNIASHCGLEKKPLDEKLIADQENLCLSYFGEEQTACWMETSHLYGFQNPADPQKIFESCKRAPEESDAAACYMHASASLATRNTEDRVYLSSICQPLLGTDYFQGCTRTVVFSLLGASTSFSKVAADFCSVVPEQYINSCYSRIVEYALGRKSDDRRKICEFLPKQYKNKCN